jgi:hypothetical protein
MFLDFMPMWGVLLSNLILVFASLEVGVRLGRIPLLRSKAKLEVSGAMVAAIMALLTFILAFTFNSAAGRHDSRKTLVIEEANAIETTWLRAGFLAEPQRSEVRGLLRNYVDLRVNAASGGVPIADALQQSDVLQGQMWNMALEAGRQNQESVMTSLFVQSLNEVLDLHVKRVTVGLRNRVPHTVWMALHLLMIAGMVMIGMQLGLGGTRHYGAEIALGVSFALVLFLIVDLDRPQAGLINVSQEAMVDLQARLAAH